MGEHHRLLIENKILTAQQQQQQQQQKQQQQQQQHPTSAQLWNPFFHLAFRRTRSTVPFGCSYVRTYVRCNSRTWQSHVETEFNARRFFCECFESWIFGVSLNLRNFVDLDPEAKYLLASVCALTNEFSWFKISAITVHDLNFQGQTPVWLLTIFCNNTKTSLTSSFIVCKHINCNKGRWWMFVDEYLMMFVCKL